MKNTNGKPVAVVVGATSKWQSDGRNTRLAHGKALDDSRIPVGARWGVGGAIAQIRTGRLLCGADHADRGDAIGLAAAIREQRGDCTVVELDLASQDFVATAFDAIRHDAGDPEVLVYNAGYLEGRDPAAGQGIAGIYLGRDVRRDAAHRLPGSVPGGQAGVAGDAGEAFRLLLLFQQLEVAARHETEDRGILYYPRVMMRTLAQVLTEEYSEFGVHVANIVIDGTIDLPGTRALPKGKTSRTS